MTGDVESVGANEVRVTQAELGRLPVHQHGEGGDAAADVERVVAPMSLELPVRKGQRVGVVRVYDGRTLVATRPLVARRNVDAPGRMAKVGWYAKETLRNVGGLFS